MVVLVIVLVVVLVIVLVVMLTCVRGLSALMGAAVR